LGARRAGGRVEDTNPFCASRLKALVEKKIVVTGEARVDAFGPQVFHRPPFTAAKSSMNAPPLRRRRNHPPARRLQRARGHIEFYLGLLVLARSAALGVACVRAHAPPASR